MKYSIVLPIYNEEDNIYPLIEEIESALAPLSGTYEILAIDDGSTDKSPEILAKLANKKNFLRVISFVGNFGQTSAFDAGFKHAAGEFIITMDADRQNDPADILSMIPKTESFDLVCGQRVNRKDSLFKKWISKISNTIRGWVCKDNTKDTGCSLKIYRRSCLQSIKLYHGMHRFLPALFHIEGYSVTHMPVNHRPRTEGKSKYHFFNRSLGPLIDMFAVWWMRRRQLHYKIKD